MKHLFALLIFLCAYSAVAQCTFTSTGGGGDWNNGATWSVVGTGCTGTPGASTPNDDFVIIADGDEVLFNLGSTIDIDGLTFEDNAILTYNTNNGDLDVNGNVNVSLNSLGSATSSIDLDATTPPSGTRLDIFGALNIDLNTTFQVGGVRFNDVGTTTINGTLEFTSTEAVVALDDIIVTATGTWNNGIVAEDFSIGGDITSNGTWIGCSNVGGCNYVMTAATSSISGTVSISDLIINGTDVCTNNGDLTITDFIRGSGTFNNAGTVTFTNNSDVTITLSTFNASGTLVIYSGSSNQNMIDEDHYDVEFNMDASSTQVRMVNDVTIDNDLTLTRGRFRVQSANNMAIGGNVVMENGAEFEVNTVGSTVNIAGDFTLNNGLLDHNDGIIDIDGTLTINEGTNISGSEASHIINSTMNVNQLSIQEATLTVASGTTTIEDTGATSVDINTNGIITVTSGTFNVDGSIDINGSAAEFRPNGITGVTTVAGNINLADGEFDHNNGTVDVLTDIVVTGGTMTMNEGTSNSVINAVNLSVTNATASLPEGDLTLSGTITLNTGATMTQNNSDGNIVAASYILNDNAIANHNNGSFTVGDITVNGASNNLNIENSTFESTGTLTINDGRVDFENFGGAYNFNDVLIQTNGTWTVTTGNGSADPIISGNFTNNGTFNSCSTTSGCIYTFDGDNTTISGSSVISFTDLTINTTAATPNINLGRDVDVTNQLSMTAGDLVLGSFNLTLGESASVLGGSTSTYIQQTGTGRVIKEYPLSSFSNQLDIPFGDATTYAPMTFTLNSGSGVAAGAQISFEYNNASGHPNRDNDNSGDMGDDDGTAATAYLNDYWEFDLSNISSIDFSASGDFQSGGVVGSTGSMVPVILRTGTPPMGSSTIDWHVVGANASKGSGSVSSTTVTFINVNNVINTTSNWVLYAMDNATERLPITLISFDVYSMGDQVQLEWATADEENNDFFTIERSVNGIDFQTLMTLDGAGNSAGRIDYSVIDAFPLEGRSYYRLKQTDFNGQFSYSEVKSVFMDNVSHKVQLYRNPVRVGDEVRLLGLERLDVNTELNFITLAGQVVTTVSAHELRNNGLRMLNPGLYLIKIDDQLHPQTLKLIVR